MNNENYQKSFTKQALNYFLKHTFELAFGEDAINNYTMSQVVDKLKAYESGTKGLLTVADLGVPTNSIGENGKIYPEERKSMVECMVNIKFPHKTISGKQNYMTLTEEEAINLYSDLKGTLGNLV